MIYGLNFNGTQIPQPARRKFKERIKIEWLPRGHYYRLVGVCDSLESVRGAFIQADNGHRLIHVEVRRAPISMTGKVYGIYIY